LQDLLNLLQKSVNQPQVTVDHLYVLTQDVNKLTQNVSKLTTNQPDLSRVATKDQIDKLQDEILSVRKQLTSVPQSSTPVGSNQSQVDRLQAELLDLRKQLMNQPTSTANVDMKRIDELQKDVQSMKLDMTNQNDQLRSDLNTLKHKEQIDPSQVASRKNLEQLQEEVASLRKQITSSLKISAQPVLVPSTKEGAPPVLQDLSKLALKEQVDLLQDDLASLNKRVLTMNQQPPVDPTKLTQELRNEFKSEQESLKQRVMGIEPEINRNMSRLQKEIDQLRDNVSKQQPSSNNNNNNELTDQIKSIQMELSNLTSTVKEQDRVNVRMEQLHTDQQHLKDQIMKNKLDPERLASKDHVEKIQGDLLSLRQQFQQVNGPSTSNDSNKQVTTPNGSPMMDNIQRDLLELRKQLLQPLPSTLIHKDQLEKTRDDLMTRMDQLLSSSSSNKPSSSTLNQEELLLVLKKDLVESTKQQSSQLQDLRTEMNNRSVAQQNNNKQEFERMQDDLSSIRARLSLLNTPSSPIVPTRSVTTTSGDQKGIEVVDGTNKFISKDQLLIMEQEMNTLRKQLSQLSNSNQDTSSMYLKLESLNDLESKYTSLKSQLDQFGSTTLLTTKPTFVSSNDQEGTMNRFKDQVNELKEQVRHYDSEQRVAVQQLKKDMIDKEQLQRIQDEIVSLHARFNALPTIAPTVTTMVKGNPVETIDPTKVASKEQLQMVIDEMNQMRKQVLGLPSSQNVNETKQHVIDLNQKVDSLERNVKEDMKKSNETIQLNHNKLQDEIKTIQSQLLSSSSSSSSVSSPVVVNDPLVKGSNDVSNLQQQVQTIRKEIMSLPTRGESLELKQQMETIKSELVYKIKSLSTELDRIKSNPSSSSGGVGPSLNETHTQYDDHLIKEEMNQLKNAQVNQKESLLKEMNQLKEQLVRVMTEQQTRSSSSTTPSVVPSQQVDPTNLVSKDQLETTKRELLLRVDQESNAQTNRLLSKEEFNVSKTTHKEQIDRLQTEMVSLHARLNLLPTSAPPTVTKKNRRRKINRNH